MAERLRRGTENLLLAGFYYSFASSHLAQAQMTHHWLRILPIIIQETLLMVLFLSRRPSTNTTTDPFNWLVAIIGTFAALAIRPSATTLAVGPYLQLVGFSISISALLSLRRSIGIVAANRGVQTGGAYRVVRHPMYAGHLLCLLGYLATYPSVYNGALVFAVLCCMVARIAAEETLLVSDAVYRAYYEQTPWRVIPGVF